MDKEFCNYTQALALKELGFDEPCMAIYYSKDKSFSWHHHKDHTNNEPTLDSGEFNISAPTYSAAFRFFRERHDMHHGIGFTGSWYYDIDSMKNTENAVYEVAHKWNMKTYEEAEKACLEKLIEITKTKTNG